MPRIHKYPDFVTVTERIDIKIGGHIEGKQYMHLSVDRIVAHNEKLFFPKSHIL